MLLYKILNWIEHISFIGTKLDSIIILRHAIYNFLRKRFDSFHVSAHFKHWATNWDLRLYKRASSVWKLKHTLAFDDQAIAQFMFMLSFIFVIVLLSY